jgi:hypothetical protein
VRYLRAARTLVREHCRSNDVPYVETSLFSSYRTVIRYLNRDGLVARDPFQCPLALTKGRVERWTSQ